MHIHWQCVVIKEATTQKLSSCQMIVHFCFSLSSGTASPKMEMSLTLAHISPDFHSSTVCSIIRKQYRSRFLAFINVIFFFFSLFCSSPARTLLLFSGNLNRRRMIFRCRFYLIILNQLQNSSLSFSLHEQY